MSFRLRPLADRVIVEQFSAEEISKGGIIIPDSNKEKPLIGKVLAAGPGRYDDDDDSGFVPMSLKTNDVIYFGRFAAMHIELDGKEYLVLKEGDVLAVDEHYNKKETKK